MQIRPRKMVPMVMAAVMAAPLLMTGCAVHGRVYDSYDHQYRQWAPESGFYIQWENENHYRHERYERRRQNEQQAYWEWRARHNGDRDRDHDRDHDHDRH